MKQVDAFSAIRGCTVAPAYVSETCTLASPRDLDLSTALLSLLRDHSALFDQGKRFGNF